jgi:transcriptional regulator with XRE-family HTH domain
MTIAAHFEESPASGAAPRAERKVLRLDTIGVSASAGSGAVTIHNISATGLLLESDAELQQGETIGIDLPLADNCQASVVWRSGSFYGCQFAEPLSQAALSAAELRGQAPARASGQHARGASFGARLQRMRTERGLTMANIADGLGVSRPTVWAWEHGKARPADSRLTGLAALLGVSRANLTNEGSSPDVDALIAQSREQIAAAYGIDSSQVKIWIAL